MVDCNDAGSKECHHAKHAAFDTEKVALMHGIFQLLQTPAGESQQATHRVDEPGFDPCDVCTDLYGFIQADWLSYGIRKLRKHCPANLHGGHTHVQGCLLLVSHSVDGLVDLPSR